MNGPGGRSLYRRSVLRGTVGLAAAGSIASPFVSNAASKTATVWWTQGFVREEDEALNTLIADYEKLSGNKIEASIIPFGPLMQKIVSALTVGDSADVMQHEGAANTVVPQNAWNDKMHDLDDIVEPLKAKLHPTAYLATRYFNSVTRERRAYYAPLKIGVSPFHVWGSLVEKAGFKIADAPRTWDAFFDFFKPMQNALRGKGMRGVFALGLQPTTTGPADGNALFHHFLIANGGGGIVTPDGKPHLDDPAVKEAVLKSLTYITTAYKEGYVPPGALSWNDADDNNAFHARQIVMDLDGTISTEVSLYHEKAAYDDVITLGLGNDNAGKPMTAFIGISGAFVPKTAKNPDVGKEFLKFMIQPETVNLYLKTGLGRFLPTFPDLVKQDPFWLDPSDPHRVAYTTEALLQPTVASYPVFNPGYAEANAKQIWGLAEAEIIRNGVTPQAAADKALRTLGDILAKYPVAQL